jgi:FMN phosphatase YigB (HAD superfamily)
MTSSPRRNPIQAIVFDCFGVLTTDGWLPLKANYFSHDPQLFQQATELNRQVDAGALTYAQFVARIAHLAGISAAAVRTAIESNVANQPLFDFIADRLKPRYRLGLLSNAGANWLDELFTPDQIKLFDAIALSYQTGYIKPQPQAYQSIADRLGLPLSACLLIDDQPAYCQAAIALGMPAIPYHNLQQLERGLVSAHIL